MCIPHYAVLHKVNPTTAAVCCTKSYVALANVVTANTFCIAEEVYTFRVLLKLEIY